MLSLLRVQLGQQASINLSYIKAIPLLTVHHPSSDPQNYFRRLCLSTDWKTAYAIQQSNNTRWAKVQQSAQKSKSEGWELFRATEGTMEEAQIPGCEHYEASKYDYRVVHSDA